jgi:hypothetical protein
MGTSTARIATPAAAVRPAVITKAVAPAATTSNNTATDRSKAAVATPSGGSDKYTGLWDMINGGGKGRGYTNLADMFNGGGMNASSSGPTTTGVSPASETGGYRNNFFNRSKPLLGLLLGGPMGMMLGKTFQRDDQGQSGLNRIGEKWGFADGGATDGVPIVAAGGEYVIPPEDVVHIGGGDMDHGHKVLDAFVKKMRQKTIKTLQGLPGPKKD